MELTNFNELQSDSNENNIAHTLYAILNHFGRNQ